MQLHFRKLESTATGTAIIILHGVFGSSDNLLTVAKTMAETHPVYLVDQRNHGKSPWSEEFNYDAMSADLAEFIQQHGLQQPIIIGHSMGGKTAMRFATQPGANLSKLIVVDIAPKYYPIHHQRILAGLQSIDLAGLQNRQQADDQLAQHVDGFDVRQFLLKNLYRDEEGKFGFRINLSVIARDIEHVGEALPQGARFDKPTLFIRGSKSDYIKDNDMTLIKQIFPQATLETIQDAGHWIHAEKPEEFLEHIRAFVNAQ